MELLVAERREVQWAVATAEEVTVEVVTAVMDAVEAQAVAMAEAAMEMVEMEAPTEVDAVAVKAVVKMGAGLAEATVAV